jgi:hypothetical protein
LASLEAANLKLVAGLGKPSSTGYAGLGTTNVRAADTTGATWMMVG